MNYKSKELQQMMDQMERQVSYIESNPEILTNNAQYHFCQTFYEELALLFRNHTGMNEAGEKAKKILENLDVEIPDEIIEDNDLHKAARQFANLIYRAYCLVDSTGIPWLTTESLNFHFKLS